MAIAIWRGTDRELGRLRRAVARNCDCAGGRDLAPSGCVAHTMLSNQANLDRLLYVYRMRRLFITREFYSLTRSQVTGVTAE
jgi:hypothetical protein